MTLICETVIFALVQLFAAQIISIFNGEPEVIEVGVQYLRYMAFAYLAHCFLDGYQSMANGVGFSMLSFICCTVDGLIVRIPLAWLFGWYGAWAFRACSWAVWPRPSRRDSSAPDIFTPASGSARAW